MGNASETDISIQTNNYLLM